MDYRFDEHIERRGTGSMKYDHSSGKDRPKGLLPLWVADMDFLSPPEVIQALEDRVRHGIYGYGIRFLPGYVEALQRWYLTRFGWEIQSDWVVLTPGVVYSIATAIRTLTKPGDAVLIQPPVYYPFAELIKLNKRSLVTNQLQYENGRYSFDFEDFERKIRIHEVKLFILCSPHNPVGRVWTEEELRRLGRICLDHGVTILSDEIHADFVYPGYRHTVLSSVSTELANCTITCTAPSKTFNLAGLQTANIIIPNQAIKKRFIEEMAAEGVSYPSILGLTACQTAYEKGGPWLEQLLVYLKGNLDHIRVFLLNRLPELYMVQPEGSYLVWIDCSKLGLNGHQLDDLMMYKAGLWVDEGRMFGIGGEGFIRINIACPRSLLSQAMLQLEQAVRSIV